MSICASPLRSPIYRTILNPLAPIEARLASSQPYIFIGSDGNLAGLPTTARTTDLWLPNASGTYVQYGNGEVGIVDGDAVWCQPSATNYTDGTDDLSGGPETVDLTSPGTGDYTLSVIGTAAGTVAAGTAVGTGFGQATEGSPVTFNLSSAGTVTLTLDSGSLDTIGSSAAKQIEKNAFATSFIPTPAGTPVAINATQPVVPWPSGLGSGSVLAFRFTPGSPGDRSIEWIFSLFPDTPDDQHPGMFLRIDGSGNLRIQLSDDAGTVVDSLGGPVAVSANTEYEARIVLIDNDFRFFIGSTKEWTDTSCTISSTFADLNIGWSGDVAALGSSSATAFHGKIRDVRILKVAPNITDAEVLAL